MRDCGRTHFSRPSYYTPQGSAILPHQHLPFYYYYFIFKQRSEWPLTRFQFNPPCFRLPSSHIRPLPPVAIFSESRHHSRATSSLQTTSRTPVFSSQTCTKMHRFPLITNEKKLMRGKWTGLDCHIRWHGSSEGPNYLFQATRRDLP